MGKKKIRFLENKNYLKLLTLLALLFLVLIFKNNNLQNLVLIFLGFYLVVILSPKETRVIILVAFTLRLILLLVNSYLFTLPEVIGSDAGMFEATALNWSQNGLAWLFNNFTSGAFLYSWFIAVFYVIFGHNPFLIEFINVLFGTFTVLVVYLICGEIFSRKEALISAFITSIFPSLVYFSVVMLREAPAVFFFTYGTYLLLKWFKEGYVGYLIAS
ncbi:MAG: glycosyltransferase family 39 protein, partial [Nitrososphaeria archaeon]